MILFIIKKQFRIINRNPPKQLNSWWRAPKNVRLRRHKYKHRNMTHSVESVCLIFPKQLEASEEASATLVRNDDAWKTGNARMIWEYELKDCRVMGKDLHRSRK